MPPSSPASSGRSSPDYCCHPRPPTPTYTITPATLLAPGSPIATTEYWFGTFPNVPTADFPPPPAKSFPRWKWRNIPDHIDAIMWNARAAHRPPGLSARDKRAHQLEWSARGGSIQWLYIDRCAYAPVPETVLSATPDELVVEIEATRTTRAYGVAIPARLTPAVFAVAVVDKMLEINLWLRALRCATGTSPPTVADWHLEMAQLLAPVLALAIGKIPRHTTDLELEEATKDIHLVVCGHMKDVCRQGKDYREESSRHPWISQSPHTPVAMQDLWGTATGHGQTR